MYKLSIYLLGWLVSCSFFVSPIELTSKLHFPTNKRLLYDNFVVGLVGWLAGSLSPSLQPNINYKRRQRAHNHDRTDLDGSKLLDVSKSKSGDHHFLDKTGIILIELTAI